MNVIEIFSSIEGEGTRQGRLCTFLRLYGCNLRCSYCDTPYSYEGNEYTIMSVEVVTDRIRALGNPLVTITGGEPLLQQTEVFELIALLGNEYDFNIETNGTIVSEERYPNVFYTYDYKCPSSNEEAKMHSNLLGALTHKDVLKFVVGTEEDLVVMKHILDTNEIAAHVYISPIYEHISGETIVDFMKANQLHRATLQLQIHKYIWDPNRRGV